MMKQFKETQMEGRRLLYLGIAACMLLLVMVICHAEPVFAKNFEMDLDANKVTYTLTEAKSGSVIFGEANTTGYIYIGQKPDTFVVKNDTDKVIRVGMYVTTESPVTLTWFADFGPALMSQTINRSESAVITGQTAKPGEEVAVQYGYIKEENKNVKTLPRLKVIARITVTDEPVYKTVVKKSRRLKRRRCLRIRLAFRWMSIMAVQKSVVFPKFMFIKVQKRSRLLQVLPQVNTHLLIRQKGQVRQNIRRKSK